MSDDRKKLDDDAIASAKNSMKLGTGYSRPPAEHRFQKGKSGNPAGRPKSVPRELTLSDEPFLEAVLKVAGKSIKVREGDKVVEMTMYDAMANAFANFALKGNARYAGLVLDTLRFANQANARKIQLHNEFWRAYKAEWSEAIARARETGEAAPHPLPHPDDIEIDHRNGTNIRGPIDEDENRNVLHGIQCCDVLLMQDALDHRSAVRLDGSPLDEPGAAMVMFCLLQKTLPRRLQMSDIEILSQQMQLEAVTKRELLKRLYEGWRKVGKPRPRGYVSVNRSVEIRVVTRSFELYREIVAGEIRPEDYTTSEFESYVNRRVYDRAEHKGRSLP